jgi:hypothetical protein
VAVAVAVAVVALEDKAHFYLSLLLIVQKLLLREELFVKGPIRL